jgi:hypothetical protein
VQTRKLLIMNKIFYKDQSHDRLYLLRCKGGMWLIEIDSAYKVSIVSLAQYIYRALQKSCYTLYDALSKGQKKVMMQLDRFLLF